MARQFALCLLLLLAVALTPVPAGAQTPAPDPADVLPGGTRVLKTVAGDVDGDGQDDTVTLYALRLPSGNVARAGLLVLLAADAGARPLHLFGAPPNSLRGEPILDVNGSSDLVLQDLTGDGRPEIVLTVVNRFQAPAPRTSLWVFGMGMVDASSPGDDLAPTAPTWAGTGFTLLAFLEGPKVTILPALDGSPSQASALRRETSEPRLGGTHPTLAITETFYWRNDGFRLGARSLTLPDNAAGVASSPETAVLSFYAAVGRGDLLAATTYLTAELRASRSSNAASNLSAPSTQMRVEEIRLAHDYLTRRDGSDAERDVYVRVSLSDPRTDAPVLNDLNASSAPTGRQTDAGVWRVRKEGDQWRLVAGTLHQTADIVAITDALPGGVTPIQTDGGDLRGRGVEDVAALVTRPGRLPDAEPYVLFGGPDGFEPAARLATFVAGGLLGGPGGVLSIEDVNRDGTPEIAFNGFVGAHSATLWVLRWDGSTLAPLFAETSNSPAIGLEDLDGDGIAEIVLGQSGYCGSYAASPQLTFVFRWEDGGYRSASWRFPSMNEGIDEFAGELLAPAHGATAPTDARVCIEHMLAMSHALRGHPADARAAYRAYAEHRQQLTPEQQRFVRPSYLPAPYVEADLHALLAAAESGHSRDWGSSERAVIYDLLGDALTEQANFQQFSADDLSRRGKVDAAREARQKSSEARQAATEAYQAALALDPTDEEARRAVGE